MTDAQAMSARSGETVGLAPKDASAVANGDAREQEIRLRAIEEVIGWIEETSFRELGGIFAKRKRVREDAKLRGETIREERAALVRMVRARLGNESGTAIRALREIRDGEFGHKRGISHYDLMDATILADRKLITLTANLTWGAGTHNTATADAAWHAQISDKGRQVLDAIAMDARQGGDADATPSRSDDSAGRQASPDPSTPSIASQGKDRNGGEG